MRKRITAIVMINQLLLLAAPAFAARISLKNGDLPNYDPTGATGKVNGWLNITY